MIKVTLDELLVDQTGRSPIVILKETHGERKVPIWIGPTEAYAIYTEWNSTPAKRPLTHDLFASILAGLKAEVDQVVVSDIVEGVYYGELFVRAGAHIAKIDARPSDCIALALRAKAPIYVSEKIMGQAEDQDKNGASAQELRDRLRKIAPEDFGETDM
ncbi:MAG: bifunctional nuclease family protein [Candidatus Latescibacterota bacterium]